jgi:hypothetical protein
LWTNGGAFAWGELVFILFIDDITRWTEVEILKEKSEALAVFKVFKANVEKKHGRSIKALQTDGGGEYTLKAFATFLLENGIEKETTGLRHLIPHRKIKFQNGPTRLFLEGHVACSLTRVWQRNSGQRLFVLLST